MTHNESQRNRIARDGAALDFIDCAVGARKGRVYTRIIGDYARLIMGCQ